jgi:hypothetical protein
VREDLVYLLVEDLLVVDSVDHQADRPDQRGLAFGKSEEDLGGSVNEGFLVLLGRVAELSPQDYLNVVACDCNHYLGGLEGE